MTNLLWRISRWYEHSNGAYTYLDIDCALERRLLRIVSLKSHSCLAVPDAISGDWRMMANLGCQYVMISLSTCFLVVAYLTCSLTSWVVPAASSHLPRNSSPRKGFKGFFSLPSFSLRLAYCCFRVLKNHLSTNTARFAGSFSAAGAMKMEGCSAQ